MTYSFSCPEFEINTEAELMECLNDLRAECIKLINTDLIIDKALEHWNLFKARVSKKLLIPNIIFDPRFPTDDLGIIISFYWKNKTEWLCCDLLVDGSFEFQYRNKITKEELGEDYHPENNDFPEGIFKLLSKFTED